MREPEKAAQELPPTRLMVDRVDAGKVFTITMGGQRVPVLFIETGKKITNGYVMPVYARALRWAKDQGVTTVIYFNRSARVLFIAPVAAFPPALPVQPNAAYNMPQGNRLTHKAPWFDVPDRCQQVILYDPAAAAAQQAAMWGDSQ